MTVGLPQWGAHAFAAIRGEPLAVLFDPPRAQPWHHRHRVRAMDETAIEIAEAVRAGERTAVEVLDECLADGGRRQRARSTPSSTSTRAWRAPAAEAVDAAVARGEDPGPFAGVPFGVKDLDDCAGMPTSHGSLLYKGRGPVERPTRSTSPGSGRRAACRSARRPRPSSAR